MIRCASYRFKAKKHFAKQHPYFGYLVACLFVLLSFGCSTHAKRISQPRNLFYDGQLQACRESLEKLALRHGLLKQWEKFKEKFFDERD